MEVIICYNKLGGLQIFWVQTVKFKLENLKKFYQS